MSSQEVHAAEEALRAELNNQGNGDDAPERIRNIYANPAQFKDRNNALGRLARALIGRQLQHASSLAVQPIDVSSQPPRPGRSFSQALNVKVPILNTHRHFRPLGLGGILYPEAPAEHKFSHLRIDHHLSGFERDSPEETAIRYLYIHLMYESKPYPPCKEKPGDGPAAKRGPFFSVREHDYAPPAETLAHKEVLIFGSTQLSKTPEACVTCWCAFFIDGCLPILCVRNKGGANSGSADMRSGIEGLNKRIEQLFRAEVLRGNIKLRENDYSKFLLTARRSSSQEYVEFDANSLLLARPQVYIICMNPGQVMKLIRETTAKQEDAGAKDVLFNIMTGETSHPYPPKCDNPYTPFDQGVNRPVARIYLVLDEDDLNRSDKGSVTERLQFDIPPHYKAKLEAGLAQLTVAGLAAGTASPSGAATQAEDDEDDLQDQPSEDEADSNDYAQEGLRFKTELTGIRSAVRGVVALTATPAACGHAVPEGASRIIHQVSAMEHPANYVGYEFTAADYAERRIRHEPVPDRKQIVAISKTVFYKAVLEKHKCWDDENDCPYSPFMRRRDGAITVYKRHLDGNEDAMAVAAEVGKLHKESMRKSDKVLESDGVGIALMLASMAELDPLQEPERRALVISNYTRTFEQKNRLAHHILKGHLMFEDGKKLPNHAYEDVFVVIFSHMNMRIMWRGSDEAVDELPVIPAHQALDVLNAIRDASKELYEGCKGANGGRSTQEPKWIDEEEGNIKRIDTKFCNINHVYTALLLYAYRRRFGGRSFKLKTIVLAGELGGRGVNYKPHGKLLDAENVPLIAKHEGYLTDMLFMFDAVVNRQITTHGEYTLQAIGRLCGLTTDECLARMAVTPPRLWTSHSCYGVIRVFALGVQQWVVAMQHKEANESIGAAVVRCIQSDPERFAALHMIYALPTTDPQWSTKELYVPPSRLKRADKTVGNSIRDTPRMPPVIGTFGIQHDPERDQRDRLDRLMADFEAREEGENKEDEEGEEDDNQRPQQRQRVMRDSALSHWWSSVQSSFGRLIAEKEEDDQRGDGAGIGDTAPQECASVTAGTLGKYIQYLSSALFNLKWIETVEDLRIFAAGANNDLKTRIKEQNQWDDNKVNKRLGDLQAAIRKALEFVPIHDHQLSLTHE